MPGMGVSPLLSGVSRSQGRRPLRGVALSGGSFEQCTKIKTQIDRRTTLDTHAHTHRYIQADTRDKHTETPTNTPHIFNSLKIVPTCRHTCTQISQLLRRSDLQECTHIAAPATNKCRNIHGSASIHVYTHRFMDSDT